MWLYFNRKGQLIDTVEDAPARAGTTSFEIFAVFEGMEDIDYSADYSNATIKLRKPDYDGSEYPLLLMERTTKTFDLPDSKKFENGEPYGGFVFDFGDFNTTQESEVLLDTPGLWLAIITVIGANRTLDVQGIVTFNVEEGIHSTDSHEMSIDTILNSIYTRLNETVPYTGATRNVDLGLHRLNANSIETNSAIFNSVSIFNSPLQAKGGITLGNANVIKPITMNSSTSNGRFIRLYPTENNTGVFDIYFPAANGTLATQEWVNAKGYLVASDISGKANNSEVVHNTGAEQIDGGKTFNSFTQHKSGLIVGASNTIKPITMHSSTANGRAIRLYPTENNSSNFDIYLPAANGTLATINYVDNSTKLYKHTVELAKYGANNYIVVVFYTKSSTDFNINALLEAYGGTNNELAIPFSGNSDSNPAIGNFSQIITSQDSQTGYAVIGEWLVSGNGGNFSDFSFDIDFIFDYVEEVQ